jgi:alcohol dehydrogenase (cytochrome c)
MRLVRLLVAITVLLWPVFLTAQIPYERIARAESEPASWLTYSGSYRSHRFSPLKEIGPDNVAALRPTWVYQVKEPGLVETTPVVADGVVYLTEPPSTVTALDVRSGRRLWTWSPSMPEDVLALGFPPVNRGVAILDETVFVGTLDAHLVALDAKSGAVRWDIVVGDNSLGYSITSAPLAIDGKIVIGVSGAEAGIRGFLDAYSARNGERLWRFWTVPSPGEPGSETWGGDSWETGGGSTWLTGSYDPELDLLYWGIGNPAPDWNADSRPGDNLYTCSLIAIEASSGELKWHFQFTPHDVHDWDANQIPVLLEAEVAGQQRKLVAMANRNAFFYLLDRQTGEFLLGAPYARQTWADGLDKSGRPIVLSNSEPSVEGTLVYPSLQGAANWFSPSYSSLTGLFYVAVREMGAYYFKGEAEYEPGTYFLGGGEQALSGDSAYGAVRALTVGTGEIKWEFRLLSPPWAGVLSTAGGVVFGGTNEGNFFALDAGTGEPLWDFQTGGRVRSNPISFLIDGKQHVAIAAGQSLFVFGLM